MNYRDTFAKISDGSHIYIFDREKIVLFLQDKFITQENLISFLTESYKEITDANLIERLANALVLCFTRDDRFLSDNILVLREFPKHPYQVNLIYLIDIKCLSDNYVN